MLLRLLLLLCLFPVCAFGPGFFIIRRIDLTPMERIVFSVGLSLLLLYLASFGIYLMALPPAAAWAVSLGCAHLLAAGGRDLRRLLENPDPRRILGWFGLAVLWMLTLLALIRGYSGGGWVGDWYEHYLRAQFFVEHLPRETTFLGYSLPARPPMMNLIAAFFMSQVGEEFALFQVVCTLLNVTVFLSACLLCSLSTAGWRRALPGLCALFALSPMMSQNSTYSWTKLLAAFYVVSGICAYVAGRRDPRTWRMTLAFVLLSAGILVHYSAVPYALFVAIHYAVFVLPKRPASLREAVVIGLVCAALLGTWFGWSIGTFGGASTVSATSSVRDAAALTASGNAAKVVKNVWYTLVPDPLREADSGVVRQANRLGFLRDFFFILYQTNFLFAFGLVSVFLMLRQILRSARDRSPGETSSAGFWVWLVSFCGLLGIAVHGTEVPLGLAHISLQPLVVLGLVYQAAGSLLWPSLMRVVAGAGLALDLLLGILLHIHLEGTTFGLVSTGAGQSTIDMSDGFSAAAYLNWGIKQRHHLVFLGDITARLAPLLWVMVILLSALFLYRMIHPADPALRPVPAERSGRSGYSGGKRA